MEGREPPRCAKLHWEACGSGRRGEGLRWMIPLLLYHGFFSVFRSLAETLVRRSLNKDWMCWEFLGLNTWQGTWEESE